MASVCRKLYREYTEVFHDLAGEYYLKNRYYRVCGGTRNENGLFYFGLLDLLLLRLHILS
jgi:hypothetical protein